MAIRRDYRCDLCGESPKKPVLLEPDLIGLKWENHGTIVEAGWHTVERHICAKCLSSLQAFAPICGDGFRACPGGPKCQSDHK